MATDDYFLRISKNPLDAVSKHISPQLVGDEWLWIRRAALLLLTTNDDAHLRSRLHILLAGPPGTGKTDFLLWMRQHVQGVHINAELTSKVGLVGDARGYSIKPGLLANCDRNVLLADELDKMPAKDQNGLLQAMEEGGYTITKGSASEYFTSEIRVIGTTNSLKKIQRPLLDRFDFVFNVGSSSRQIRASNVGNIVEGFMTSQDDKHGIFVKKYLQWVGNYKVEISDDDKFIIKNKIQDYILNTSTNIKGVSYRSLEYSILRIAYATAKLSKTRITREHIDDAIWLKDQMLKNLVGERNVRY